jgi:putative DNA methylase
MTTDRRLIEDFIPIKEISVEAAREKSIRKGHISTLHLWWARRPIVAARAAVFASLVAAPESYQKRSHLKKQMIDLCKWEAVPETINKAKDAILEAQRERLGLPVGTKLQDVPPPKVLDMFAGGGAIPLEALRLGCETFAVDLNPVAHIIELCTLVYPQRYGKKLADEVESWGNWVIGKVRSEIGDLYPVIRVGEVLADRPEQMNLLTAPPPKQLSLAQGLTPVAYLWTRTVKCPNPACGADVPLVRQTWLCKKAKKYVALRVTPNHVTMRVEFEVVEAATEKDLGFDPAAGSSRGNSTCRHCGTTVGVDVVKTEGMAGRIRQQLMAIVCTTVGEQGKTYLAGSHYERYVPDGIEIKKRLDELCEETKLTVPEEPIEKKDTLNFKVPLYGMLQFKDLFTSRQLLALMTFVKWVRLAHDEMVQQGYEGEFAKAITTYLALSIGKVSDLNSSLNRWKPDQQGVVNTFSRQALPMVWDYAETNVFGNKTGAFEWALGFILNFILRESSIQTKNLCKTHRGSATSLPIESALLDAVITDPPYFDSISYADLSDFFYVWLKRSIGHLYPEHFTNQLTPKKNEAIMAIHRHGKDKKKASQAYEDMMHQAFCEAFRVLKSNGNLVVVYAHKTTSGWSTLIDSLRRAGFMITEAWPLDTEGSGRLIAHESAALASSIFLVARKRQTAAIGDFAMDVKPQLEQIITERVKTLMAEGVSGADLVIACIGAGLRAYTQFDKVELPNGDELDANSFLGEVQKAVVEAVLTSVMQCDKHGVSQVDKTTQYYIMARYEYGEAIVEFDEANTLAKGVGVELDGAGGLTDGKLALIQKTKNQVQLRDYSDRGADPELGLQKTEKQQTFNHKPDAIGKSPTAIDILHRLLWLTEHKPQDIPEYLSLAQPDANQLRLVAQSLAGRALTPETGQESLNPNRTVEQQAIDTLLASWKRAIEDNLFTKS